MLVGKTAIVTGSTSGIGLGIAHALAEAGANIVINGFGEAKAIEETRASLSREHNVGVAYSGADIMATIAVADQFGLPVSTTHVLSSGVAGTMAANKSGLQMSTVRNLVTAWVLTLPAAILLFGCLYFVFRNVF